MVTYFNLISPEQWTLSSVFKAVEKLYPEKKRSYLAFVVKEELEALGSHNRKSHRQKAEELLDSW